MKEIFYIEYWRQLRRLLAWSYIWWRKLRAYEWLELVVVEFLRSHRIVHLSWRGHKRSFSLRSKVVKINEALKLYLTVLYEFKFKNLEPYLWINWIVGSIELRSGGWCLNEDNFIALLRSHNVNLLFDMHILFFFRRCVLILFNEFNF